METAVEQVRIFHRAFGHVINTTPTLLDKREALGRVRLILDEVAELIDAMDRDDIIEIADALGDILYVVFGTVIGYGLPIVKIFDEVHRSNMSKIGGYHNGCKYVKPEHYSPVDLSFLVKNDTDKQKVTEIRG